MNALDLTKKLVEIPSYVDGEVDEQKIGQFVFDYLKQFSWLKVEKQMVSKKRFNVIAKDKYPTKVIFCGHLDTVQIKSDWKTNPLIPILKNNNLYGLGASDMKSSIAAMLSTLDKDAPTEGVMFFFYIDEEYDFLGMKKFINVFKNKIKPELIISGDGCGMQIGNGCRGLIEITFVVKGETGHAGRPEYGKNAILIATEAVNELIQTFETQFKDKFLGKSTCNLAFIQGGLDLRIKNNTEMRIGREGNNIADLAEFVIDVRPADPKLNAQKVAQLIKQFVKQQSGKVESFSVRHDLGAWITNKKELKQVETAVKSVIPVEYADLGSFGYIDTQMLWQTFNQVPCLTLGAGAIGTAHKANEYVSVSQLEKLSKVFTELLHQYGEGGVKND